MAITSFSGSNSIASKLQKGSAAKPLSQGPVPKGYSQSHFRSTGNTVPSRVQGAPASSFNGGGGQNNGAASGSGGSGRGGYVPSGPSYSQADFDRVGRAQDAITKSGQGAFTGAYNQYNSGARSLVDKIRLGQEGIDRGRQNVELEKLNTLTGLSQSLRQGIQSGSIKLAGMNATDSSGSEQLARTYGTIGTQQRSDIFNQAAIGQNDLNYDQSELDIQEAEGVRQLTVFKDDEQRRIGDDVENKLLALEEEASGLGIEGQIKAQAVRQQIVKDGVNRLKEVDNFIKTRFASINPMAQEAYQAEASRLRGIGRPEGGFDFGNLQAAGPTNSLIDLPLLGRARPEDE